MRVLILLSLLLGALPALAANEECWSRGYRDGFCDGKGAKGCTSERVITPRPSPPAAGQEDCDSRYVDGYVAGQKASMPKGE